VNGPEDSARPGFRRLAFVLFAVGIGALAAAAGLFIAGLGDDDSVAANGPGFGSGGFEAVPEANAAPPDRPALPVQDARRKETCHRIAVLRGRAPATLYRSPGGRARVRLTAKTEWGSPRVFGVLRRKGDWLAVQASELDNGELAWLPESKAISDCVNWSLHADVSERRLVVRQNGRTRRRISVAVGRPGNETPTGRFSVTDKLRVTGGGSPYGCCVLALTGHQSNLPAGWPGGDRLAVHSTLDTASIGQPASLGCLRAAARPARWLIETIPLGTPIFIRA
jgi:L,D-transpeptidase catalytic domain